MPRLMPLGSIIDIIEGFKPVDMSAGANTGDWINVKNYDGIAIHVHSAPGASGEPYTLTVLQGKTNAGGSSKALNIKTSPSHAFKKQAAADLTGTAAWSDASADCSTNTYVCPSSTGNQDRQVFIWFDADEFDMDNGFFYINGAIADVGSTAQLGSMLYLPLTSYVNSPPNVLSGIA